jgi:hypothetical protein
MLYRKFIQKITPLISKKTRWRMQLEQASIITDDKFNQKGEGQLWHVDECPHTVNFVGGISTVVPWLKPGEEVSSFVQNIKIPILT